MSNAPQLTSEERKVALEKAIAARRERADIKASLKAGEIAWRDAMNLEVMQRVKVSQFLRSIPGIGAIGADKLMIRLGISSSRRVGGLGRSQRQRLIEYLEDVIG